MARTLTVAPPRMADLVARYEAPLVRYAARILGDPDRARDVVQDTFQRLFEADPSSIDGRIPQWLYTVCRNRALDLKRRDARRRRLDERIAPPGPVTTPAEHLERREQLARAAEALAALPDKQARVLRLKLTEGLSYAEIAERTGLTPSYVGYLLHHALKAVRRELEGTPR